MRLRACALVFLLVPAAAKEGLLAEIVAAVEKGDAARLRELARRPAPPPWQVVDKLFAEGQAKAALAFAAETGDARLGAYAGSYRETEAHALLRKATIELAQAAKARDAAAVDAILARPLAFGDDVASVVCGKAAGSVLRRMNRLEDAARVSRRAAEAAERLGWWNGARSSWYEASIAAAMRGDFPAARDGWLRELELAKRLEDKETIASALGNLGLVYTRMGDWAKAEEAIRGSIELHRAHGNTASEAISVGNLGALYRDRGRHKEALPLQERALALFRQVGDKRGELRTLSNLGILYEFFGDGARALAVQERALALAQEAADVREETRILGIVGGMRAEQGDLRAAAKLLERSLELARRQGDRAAEAGALGKLASLAERTGAFERAVELRRRTLRLAEATGSLPLFASSLGMLANTLYRRGDFAGAHAAAEQARTACEKLGNEFGAVDMLSTLGLLHFALGDEARAQAALTQAVARFHALGNVPAEVAARRNLGMILSERRDFAAARKQLDAALALARKHGIRTQELAARQSLAWILQQEGRADEGIAALEEVVSGFAAGSDPASRIAARCDLAAMYTGAGRASEAIPMLEPAVESAEANSLRFLLVTALVRLAEARLRADDPAAALATARRGAGELARVVRGQSDELGARARDVHGQVFAIGGEAAMRLGDEAAAFWFLESGRAGALLESLGAARQRILPKDLRAAEAEARAKEEHAVAANRRARAGGQREQIRAARKALDAAREELRNVVERIQRNAKSAAEVLYAEAPRLEDVRANVAEDEALVVYGAGMDRAFALVITAKQARLVDLGPDAAGANEHMRRAGEPFVDPAGVAGARKRLVTPLALPAGVTRVRLAPQGRMTREPLCLVFAGMDLTYVPSVAVHRRLRAERARPGRQVLALGDPVYGTDRPRLPASAAEAKAVGDVVLLGPEASEPGLRAALAGGGRWRAIHFACHASVDSKRPVRSALALSGGQLTMVDVFTLHAPADLVVLSACETAGGRTLFAEGVLGLPRAFLHAGASQVLCSLWKVDDEATRALMVRFYEAWKKGAPAAAALRRAQDHVRAQEKWSHPYYWAAWQLWG